jgi:hypothetical protein
MEKWMRILLAVLLTLSLAIPAQARGMKRGGAQTQQGADQQKKSREEEKAYKDALRRIPNQKPADPWGKIR